MEGCDESKSFEINSYLGNVPGKVEVLPSVASISSPQILK